MEKKNPSTVYNRHLPKEENTIILTLMLMLFFFFILVSAESPKHWFETEFTVSYVRYLESSKNPPEIVATNGDFYTLRDVNTRTVLPKIHPGDRYRVICGNVPHNHIKFMEKDGYVLVAYKDSVSSYQNRLVCSLCGMFVCVIIISRNLYLISQRGKQKKPTKPKQRNSHSPRLPLP